MSSSGRPAAGSSADGISIAGVQEVVVAQISSGGVTRIQSAVAGDSGTGNNILSVFENVWNGATAQRVRTPNTFKSGSIIAAGDTALWTPAAGKKFRLMGYAMYMAGDSSIAVAGEQVILLRDGAVDTGIVRFNPFVPGAPVNLEQGGAAIQPLQLGNGYLSSAANNVLNVNLAVAYTTGNVDVMVWGTEE